MDAAAAPGPLRPWRLSTRPRPSRRSARPVSGPAASPGDGRTRGRSSSSHRSGARLAYAPGQFTMLYAFGVGEVPISISGDPARRGGLVAHRAGGRAASRRPICAARARRHARRAGPFGSRLARGRAREQRRRHRRRRHRPRARSDRRSTPCSRDASATSARSALLYGGRTPADLLFRRELERWRGRLDLDVGVTVDTGTGRLAGIGRRGHEAHRPRRIRSRVGGRLRLRPEIMMRVTAQSLVDAWRRQQSDLRLDGTQHALRGRSLRPLPVRADADLPRRPRVPLRRARAAARGARAVSRKPKLAVWKFASCDGCQLSLLDCEDELLGARRTRSRSRTSSRPRARPSAARTTSRSSRARSPRADDAERIQQGATRLEATRHHRRLRHGGGIQALRNFADVRDFLSTVYASPEYVSTLATSTPISAHVAVDFELNGCPISKRQLARGASRRSCTAGRPNVPAYSVCMECKRRGNVCVMVAHGTPCLGPVTHAGCGAICPVVQPWVLRLLRADGDARTPCR